jgi:hypothetical protein
MSIKCQLTYDKNLDTIIGVTSDGFVATHILIFMIRGLNMKWKQAVSFHFTRNTVATSSLANYIKITVLQLNSIGLTVRCLVRDQGATNVAALQSLGFDVE